MSTPSANPHLTPLDFDLVIFDCDGILVDSEPIALRLNAEMLAELGWYPSDDEIVDLFLGRSMASNLLVIEERTGRPVPEAWTERFRMRMHEAHEAELTEIAGVREALDGIVARGVSRCVASSGTPDKIRHSLARCDLAGYFGDAVFSASEVAHGKPAPDLFLHAAARMGVAPARCAVIEDSRYGVQAARAAGMSAFGYAGGLTPAEWLEGRGTSVFTDMRKLPALLTEHV